MLLACFSVHADDFDVWSAASPDATLVAAERRIPDPDIVQHLDLDGFRVVISSVDREGNSGVVARHDFPSRVVSAICWSPDSRFLLFTATSPGGHSPWHFKTYLYCVSDKTFRKVEDVTGGSVIAPEFQFEPPDIATLTIQDAAGLSDRPQMAPKQIKISLAKFVKKMTSL